jgi:hypothetical protein
MMRARIDLIPERLGIDVEPLAGHHPDLPLERQMIGVLRHGHADAKLRRIATPGHDLRGSGRRDHRPVAPAAVFLPQVVLDLIGEPHRRDPLRGFHLARHFHQPAAARRALPTVDRQFVANLDDRERRLRPRPMTGLPRSRWARRRITRAARVTVKHLCAPLFEFLKNGQLELCRIGDTAETRDLRCQFRCFRDEPLIFAIEEKTDLAKRFKVVFLGQLHHPSRI